MGVKVPAHVKGTAILDHRGVDGQRKCPHYGDIDIEPERTGKTSDPQ